MVIVTGTSGAGKSAIVPELRRRLPGVAVLDKDHMWASDWGQAYDNFFRIALSLSQTEIALVVVGTIIPEHFDGFACRERDLVDTAWINMHCSDEVREARLKARPAWRKSSHLEFIEEHRRLAARLLSDELPAGTPTVDTSARTVDDTAEQVAQLVRKALGLTAPQ